MNELSLRYKLKKLKQDWPNMTRQQRWEHLVAYYTWVIPVALLIMIGIFLCVNFFIQNSKHTVISGAYVNISVSKDGKAYMTDGYKEHFGYTSWREAARLDEAKIQSGSANYTMSYNTITKLAAMSGDGELDYLVMDKEGFDILFYQQAFKDLREVYTEQELAALGDCVIYRADSDTEENIPIAIEISQTDFAKNNITAYSEKIYFSFAVNTPRVEQTKAFYEYLFAYK